MKERLHWVDICKGFFIIMMVMGHIPIMAPPHGLENGSLLKCIFFAGVYGCFFMQGFFILTGYTSNFNKEAQPYLMGIVKSLLIPWISFSILTRLLGYCLFKQPFYDVIGEERYFFLIEDYWFIHALILAKIIYYFIRKYINSDLARFIILLIITAIGFYSIEYYSNQGNDKPYHVANYLHYKDCLCMVIFLWVGDYLKRKELLSLLTKGYPYFIILTTYLIILLSKVCLRHYGIDIPEIEPVILSHGGNIESITQVPAYLFVVFCGSISCFGICKYVGSSNFFEYFGKNSMIVYCVHFLFVDILITLTKELFLPTNIILSYAFIAIVLTGTLLLCTFIILACKHKPFNYFIGKF